MISFCCGFYPWYRQHDRSNEVFDVLIAGLNTMNGVEDTELCLVSAAVMDVWRRKNENPRKFDNEQFEEKIRKQFKGKVKYLLDENSIHRDVVGIPRYWCSKSIDTAISISANDYIVIVGIDCYITGYFVSDYFERVKKGKAWIILSTGANDVEYIEYIEANQIARFHYTARGIVGMLKDDYYKIGGYDVNYIKDQSDSNFYRRMIASDLEVKEEKVKNVYHVHHPGSHMGGGSRLNKEGRVETCKFA